MDAGSRRKREEEGKEEVLWFQFLKKRLCAMKEVPPPTLSLSSLYQGNSPGEQYKAVICVILGSDV